jgi:plasmid stabilization system protein ParE
MHPHALAEMRDSISYYRDEENALLADEFATEIDRSLDLILERPMIGKPFRRVARQFVIKRFPYSLFYQVRTDSVLIAAVAHHRRRPGYWIMRLRNGF